MRYKGHRWIMAANSRKSPTEATFVLPDIKDGTKVKVHFENDRILTAREGQFSDKFGEYGVHVYEVKE